MENKIPKYPDIARGSSLCIPIFLFDENKEPIQERYAICFTLKENLYDFDYSDKFALIQKSAGIVNIEKGQYEVRISSAETWLPPGEYYFEVSIAPELEPQNKIRLGVYQTKITGGPENKFISKTSPNGFFKGEPLCFGEYQPQPIEIFFTTYSKDVGELPLEAEPQYLIESKGFKKKVKVYGPRATYPITVDCALSDVDVKKTLAEFFPYDLGRDFVFGKGMLSLNSNTLKLSSLPSDAKAYFITEDGYQIQYPPYLFEYKVNQPVFIRVVYENQTLDIQGYKAGALWALTLTWFDLNKT